MLNQVVRCLNILIICLMRRVKSESPEEAVDNLQQSMEDLIDEMYLVEEFI